MRLCSTTIHSYGSDRQANAEKKGALRVFTVDGNLGQKDLVP